MFGIEEVEINSCLKITFFDCSGNIEHITVLVKMHLSIKDVRAL